MESAGKVRIEHHPVGGEVKVLKTVSLQAGEVIDATKMDVEKL